MRRVILAAFITALVITGVKFVLHDRLPSMQPTAPTPTPTVLDQRQLDEAAQLMCEAIAAHTAHGAAPEPCYARGGRS